MADKPEALRLAEQLEDPVNAKLYLAPYVADELRRLYAENERLKVELAAQREKLAHWMRNLGYATGHGDSMEDLLDHLGTQISEGLEVEVLMEREACANICDGIIYHDGKEADRCAAAIRARSKT